MNRRQAQAALPLLEKKFRDAFRKVGFPVYLTGAKTEDFIKAAGEVTEVVPMDYAKAIAPIRDAVKVTIGNNQEFGVSGFSALVREAKEIGSKLGLDSLASPTFRGGVYINTPEDIDKVVNSYLTEQLGAEFLVPLVEQAACDSAFSLEGEGTVVPVLVTNLPNTVYELIGRQIFGGKGISGVVDGEVTEDTVKSVFNKIKSARKSGAAKEQ